MRVFFIALIVGLVFAAGNVVYAGDAIWEGSVSDAWSDAANWQSSYKPQAGDDVLITGSVTARLDETPPDLQTFTIDGMDGFWKGLNHTFGNTLTVLGDEIIGKDGYGAVYQSGGDHAVGSALYQGYNTNGEGWFDLIDEGKLTVTGDHFIGYHGTGFFYNDRRSQHQVTGNLYVGYSCPITASYLPSYQLESYSTLNVTGNHVIGYAGVGGSFEHRGGQHTVGGDLIIGQNQHSSVDYFSYYVIETQSLSVGGVVDVLSVANDLIVGDAGKGDFQINYNQNDFDMSVKGALILGNKSTGSGSFSFGEYDPRYTNVVNVTSDIVVGNEGSGLFTQHAGTVLVRDNDTMVRKNVTISATPGTSSGLYELKGGTLEAASINNNDRFNYSGGVLTANIANAAGATVTFTGAGTRTQTGAFDNSGTFKVDNTTAEVTGTFTNSGVLDMGSNPSVVRFNDAIMEHTGYIEAGVGDVVQVAGDFANKSTQNEKWSTRNSQLVFTNASHKVMFNSEDLGALETAYVKNFAWGDVDFGLGSFDFLAQDDARRGALYTGTIADNSFAWDGDEKILGFNGNSNIYYLTHYYDSGSGTLQPLNEWLGGKQYAFASGAGYVMPVNVVPEPAAAIMFVIGGGLLGIARKRMQGRKA